MPIKIALKFNETIRTKSMVINVIVVPCFRFR